MKAINLKDAGESNMCNTIAPLRAAVVITTAVLSLCGGAPVVCGDHVFAESFSPTRRSSAVGVEQRSAGEFIPGCNEEARKVIERALATYRSVQTYQDRLIVAKGWHDKESSRKMEPSMKIACSFAKPNRIAITGPFGCLMCDGLTYWERLAPAKQYTEQKAPERIDFDEWDLGMLTFRASHPIVWLLTREEDRSVRELLGFVKEITGITAEQFEGGPGRRISGLVRMKYLPIEDPTVSFDAWFSDETGLVEEIRLDLTEAVQEMEGAERDNATYLFSLRFQNIKLDEQIRADRFVFKPEPGDTRTEEFEVPAGQKQREMIGKPAPAWSGKDMAGNELRLSDFAGRVVVLDFWATWCRGCVPGLLKLQKLAEEYAGQSISVIGINADEPGSEKRVAGFLENRSIKFRQVPDVDSKISQAYRVRGLPHTVLIDKHGMIRAIHVGLLPEKKLSLQIDRMLQDSAYQR